ncbi:class I glutamine amidotransferase-like protein [Hygrophoropsis aurantiaca]|uniref:Class I glutamine amidotransferase-like protein n=1 Tax=Hygrophoropsis aurantiaca TaxID=72124 RepID=A0ACB7ZRN4_9AGAM|nr:class I glutamine amidotransferase-like protein [Hygrophoropsis aurantiaca]
MPSTDILPPRAKIALLICDPTKAEFITAYGNITTLFTALYTNLLARPTTGLVELTSDSKSTHIESILPGVQMPFDIEEFSAIDGHLPADIDAYTSVIVSGSACGVNDKEPWIQKLKKFLRDTATLHPKVKLMGICFGHQIISRAVFDLPVKANPEGWEIGPYKIDLNETGKVLFLGKESLMIEMFHHDAAERDAMSDASRTSKPDTKPAVTPLKASRSIIWGSTEKTKNQGIVCLTGDTLNSVDDIHIFTSQGHPEVTKEMAATLVDLFEQDIDKNAVKEARKLIAAFEGDLDQDYIALLMWALSTGQSYVFPTASSLKTSSS